MKKTKFNKGLNCAAEDSVMFFLSTPTTQFIIILMNSEIL